MDKINYIKIDGGTIEERIAEAKRLFGLKPEQSFQDIEIEENKEK